MKHTSGGVTLLRQQQEGPVQAGDLVASGDRLTTTADGRCSLTLIDGARIALGPRSVLTLVQFTWDPTTRTGTAQTALTQGTAVLSAGGIAQSGPAAMQVTTPRSRILVQATTIAVEVRP